MVCGCECVYGGCVCVCIVVFGLWGGFSCHSAASLFKDVRRREGGGKLSSLDNKVCHTSGNCHMRAIVCVCVYISVCFLM